MRLHRYDSKAELYEALVVEWLASVQTEDPGETLSFALAGGTTPSPIYRIFSAKLRKLLVQQPRQVKLVATDERWVPNTDAQSNEGLIVSCFQIEDEADYPCKLVSLKTDDPSPELALHTVSKRLENEFPGSFSAVLLGMGTDGHIASLFPDRTALEEANAGTNCLAARHPATGQERISLSMSRLLNSKRAWLVITGEEKLEVLQDSERGKSQLPIARFLRNALCEIDVYWSPD